MKMNHYEILVATEYRDRFIGVLDDWGFKASENLIPEIDDEEKDISSIELKIPNTKVRHKITYWMAFKLYCEPAKLMGIRLCSKILKIPKDKIKIKLVG